MRAWRADHPEYVPKPKPPSEKAQDPNTVRYHIQQRGPHSTPPAPHPLLKLTRWRRKRKLWFLLEIVATFVKVKGWWPSAREVHEAAGIWGLFYMKTQLRILADIGHLRVYNNGWVLTKQGWDHLASPTSRNAPTYVPVEPRWSSNTTARKAQRRRQRNAGGQILCDCGIPAMPERSRCARCLHKGRAAHAAARAVAKAKAATKATTTPTTTPKNGVYST